MRLKISFDDIVDAFESSSHEMNYYIDIKNNAIGLISDFDPDIDLDDTDADETLEKIESDNSSFIMIPPRLPANDAQIIHSFAENLHGSPLLSEFIDIIFGKKIFKNFRAFLDRHPELIEKWHKHRENEIRNDIIDWLCLHNIELEDRSFIPEVKIREVDIGEIELPEGFKDFSPVACLKCGTEDRRMFKKRFFEANVVSSNMAIEKEIDRIMEEKYGFTNCNHITGEKTTVITAARCLKCGSDDIFWDM